MTNEIYLEDNIFDKTDIVNYRDTVRVIIIDDNNKLGYIRIIGTDVFGDRNHLESSGGGIEKGESHHQTIHREIQEELGYRCEIISYLGLIVQDFNILARRTKAYYYFVKVIEKGLPTNFTDLERKLFKGIEWYSVAELKELLNKPASKISTLVHQRELAALRLYEDYLAKNTGGKSE